MCGPVVILSYTQINIIPNIHSHIFYVIQQTSVVSTLIVRKDKCCLIKR